MRLESLIEALRPRQVAGPTTADIRGVACDSRCVAPGFLFAALRGANQDGHRFVADAVARGAVAVICEECPRPPPSGAAVLVVPDARQALAEAAALFHGCPARKLQTFGITGTNGKTTTAFMIRAALEAAGRKTGLIGTIQYLIGERAIPASRTTPESVELQDLLDQMTRVGCRAAVMEVSSHSLVQKRVWGIEFDFRVFTNLTHDHLDFHGSVDEYFRAKSMLFTPPPPGGKPFVSVLNLDDPCGERLAVQCASGCELLTFGEDPRAAVRAERVALDARGSQVEIASPWGRHGLRLRFLGRYNVSNALAAFAAACAAGVPPEAVLRALEGMAPVPGRLEPVPTGRGFHVFVDYAHTQDALQNVLSTLRELGPRRLIVLFGCGGNRDRRKRPLMGAVAACLADRVIVTSDNPRREKPSTIIAEIMMGIERRDHVEVIEDRREAIKRALAAAGPGDIVLVAGKGHENYQELENTVIPFDDRQVVKECLDRLP